MAEFKTVEFKLPIPPAEAMEIVDTEGMVTIHNFLPEDLREYALNALNAKYSDNEGIPQSRDQNRRFELTDRGVWEEPASGLEVPPLNVRAAARYATDYVNRAEGFDWKPTEIVEDFYEQGQFIGNHLAYSGAIGRLAFLTLDGFQDFNVKRNDGAHVSIPMQPGSVTFLRGFGEEGARQPSHYMSGAKTQRTAISVR